MRRVLCVRIKVLTTAKDTSAYFAKEEEVMNVTAVAVCHRARAISAITDMWTAPAKAGLYTTILLIREEKAVMAEAEATKAEMPALPAIMDMWNAPCVKETEETALIRWEDLTAER